jgi:hypothetical protein
MTLGIAYEIEPPKSRYSMSWKDYATGTTSSRSHSR